MLVVISAKKLDMSPIDTEGTSVLLFSDEDMIWLKWHQVLGKMINFRNEN